MVFSSSILLCFLLYVPFNVLEYKKKKALVYELHDSFETINAGNQVLNCLTFRQRQLICIRAASPGAVLNLAGNGSSP